MSLPSLEIMEAQILASKGMTKAKFKAELEKYKNNPIFKNNPGIFYHKIAVEFGVNVVVEYEEGAGSFDEGDPDTWTPIEEFTIAPSGPESYNIRGVVIRTSDEMVSKKSGKHYRWLELIDETDCTSLAVYGELMETVSYLKVGELVKANNASVWSPDSDPSFKWRSVNDRFGDIAKIKYGEFGLKENAMFKTPVMTIKEVMAAVPDQPEGFISYMIRGIFTSKEKGSRTVATCPECRKVQRGDPGLKVHCTKCEKSVYTVAHTISKFGFTDDDGTPITVQFAKSSKVDTSDIKEFSPPDEWNYYLLRGTMAQDEHHQAKNAFYAIDAIAIPNVDPFSDSEPDGFDPQDPEDETPADRHDREVEVEMAREALVNELDFSCDKDAFWPDDSNEENRILNLALDNFNNFISMLGKAEPVNLQSALQNMEKLEIPWKVRPIVIHLMEEGYIDIKEVVLDDGTKQHLIYPKGGK